ncbi:MAG: LysR substrate-binding domain-containing protein [Rhizobacter sp.]
MDLRKLSYFAAVAEMGHLGKAAERLHISQPPLSRQIQALEAELGAALFRRTPHGMSLTAAGEELLGHARTLLSLAEQAADHTRRVARGEQGRLHIGVYGSAVFGAVPRILSAFKSAHPEVELALHQAQTPQQIDALRKGRVLLVFERLLPKEPDIAVRHVVREDLWVAMAARHRFAAREAVAVDSLAGETLLVGSAPSAASEALALCRAHGFEPRFGTEATDVVAATVLASTGQGVTLVPESMVHVAFPGIAYRPLVSRVPAHMDLFCFFLKSSDSPLLESMLAIVEAMAPA